MKVTAERLGMRFHDADREIEIFRDMDFSVPSGGSVAIMGQSGAGKSTLLYLLGGLETPTSGDILVGETSYKQLRSSGGDLAGFRGKNIGFVFQFHHLLPEFDAVENVAMPLLIRGVSYEEASERASSLLKRVGLGERLGHRPGMLSGGEQQRVALARAVAGKPGVILADEPTGNLDSRTGGAVRDLLLELHSEEKVTLILVTHSLDLARSMGRVVELRSSGMVEI